MSTNKQGKKLYSLVPGWNKVLTIMEIASRKAKAQVIKNRQGMRARLLKMAINAVNKADDKRCTGVHRIFKAVRQTRKERRSLARAYAKAAWLKEK